MFILYSHKAQRSLLIDENLAPIYDYIREHVFELMKEGCVLYYDHILLSSNLIGIGGDIDPEDGQVYTLNCPTYFLIVKPFFYGVKNEKCVACAHTQGEMYEVIKHRLTTDVNMLYEIFYKCAPLKVLNESGTYTSIGSHLKIIVNNIPIKPSMIINAEFRQKHAQELQLLRDFFRDKQHMTNDYIDNIVSFKYYHAEDLKLVFDFPDYYNCFKNLSLLCNRSSIPLGCDIFKLILSYI